MEIAFFVVVSVFGLLWAFAGASAEQRRRERISRDWQAAAVELGLSSSGSENKRCITGMLNGEPVRADFRRDTKQVGKATTVVETVSFSADGADQIPMSLNLRKESPFRSFGRLVFGGDEEVGDKLFDDLVEISSMDAYACAALSEEGRRRLGALIKLGGEVRRGTLLYERMADSTHDAAWLVGMLQFFSRLAQLLSVSPGSLHERLAHNALGDSNPGVRLKNLAFLADPSTGTPVALLVYTARKLLSNPHVPVRIMAALQLGRDGSPVLSALAANPEVETALRVRALRELGTEEATVLEPLLANLLGASPPELMCSALAIIAARRLDIFSALVVDCAESEHEEVRVAAATTLGSLTAHGAEEALIRLLSDSSSKVQCASAESLGVIGSVVAVAPLLPLAERFGRSQLRQAARGALDRIQSRLGNVEAGALALVDHQDPAGALAIAEPTAAVRVGELSLAEDAESESDPVATVSSRERGSPS